MSELFFKLAEKFKEEEEQPTPTPLEFSTGNLITTEAAVQPLGTPTTSQTHTLMLETAKSADNLEQEAEVAEGEESGEEGNSRGKNGNGKEKEGGTLKSVGGESTGKTLEVVNVEEGESYDDRETLSKRAIRRSFRAQKGTG